MSIITMSPSILMGSFAMEQISYDMVEVSDPTGAEAIRLFGPPRWRTSLSAMPDMNLAQASEWEVIVLQLRRGINHLAVWDPVRVLPRGTMRGTPTLSSGAPAGSTAINLSGASGTLLKGDWLQIGTGVGTSQLVKSMSDVTAVAGAVTVTFEPALRISYSTGAVITLDRPVFYARQIGKTTKWEYQAGNMLQSGFALDLLEAFQ
jgi:hypothetical protein